MAWAPLYFTSAYEETGISILERVHYNARLRDEIWQGFIQNLDLTHALKNLSIPTLSIVGEDDPIILPEYVAAGAALNSKIFHVGVSDAAHFPFVEGNRQFLEIMTKFCLN